MKNFINKFTEYDLLVIKVIIILIIIIIIKKPIYNLFQLKKRKTIFEHNFSRQRLLSSKMFL